jgi:hypothetical protein
VPQIEETVAQPSLVLSSAGSKHSGAALVVLKVHSASVVLIFASSAVAEPGPPLLNSAVGYSWAHGSEEREMGPW